MFREIRFYDDYTTAVASPWWIFALLGVLIVIFPQLLAWLVAGCLIFKASCCWAWRCSFGGSRKITASGGKCIGCHE